MKKVKGDLILLAKDGKFDVIIHGCNCFHTMGAGIARVIKSVFPEAFEADKETVYGSRYKLGTISTATFQVNDDGDFLTVVNAYTQFDFGTNSEGTPPVDYVAVNNCFRNIKDQYGGQHLKFGIPKIGAGLAGGDWDLISRIIESQMKDEDLTLVLL